MAFKVYSLFYSREVVCIKQSLLACLLLCYSLISIWAGTLHSVICFLWFLSSVNMTYIWFSIGWFFLLTSIDCIELRKSVYITHCLVLCYRFMLGQFLLLALTTILCLCFSTCCKKNFFSVSVFVCGLPS